MKKLLVLIAMCVLCVTSCQNKKPDISADELEILIQNNKVNQFVEMWYKEMEGMDISGYEDREVVTVNNQELIYENTFFHKTEIIKPYIGELCYTSERGKWYFLQDSKDSNYLILQDEDEQCSAWKFIGFVELDSDITYKDIFEKIYHINSYKDIAAIRIWTDDYYGLDGTAEIAEQQGKYLITDTEEIKKFYDTVQKLKYTGTEIRSEAITIYQYSYPDDDYLCYFTRRRFEIISGTGNTVQEIWDYNAITGRFFGQSEYYSESMSIDDVNYINSLCGIENAK